ncbi:MAG: hypothetical protein HFH69_01455 [Lachnospiraceae bacterium]|nr:hypothetical protein [Lachnospiraceae bacterium]
MNQKEEMTNNLLEELDDYYMQLVYLKDLLDVEEDMNVSKEKLQCAPNFTLIVECALVDSYMLILMRLYDKSEKAKTILNLIKKCKKNIHLFPSQRDALTKLNEFETKMNQDECISHAIKTLICRRDSVYAHNDKKYFGKNLVKDNSYLKMYHILILVDFTEEVLNYIFSQLSTEESRKTKYNDDLRNLFKNA